MAVIQRGNKRGWFHRAGSDKPQDFLFIPPSSGDFIWGGFFLITAVINSMKHSNPGWCWAELSRHSHPSLLIPLTAAAFASVYREETFGFH